MDLSQSAMFKASDKIPKNIKFAAQNVVDQGIAA